MCSPLLEHILFSVEEIKVYVTHDKPCDRSLRIGIVSYNDSVYVASSLRMSCCKFDYFHAILDIKYQIYLLLYN